MLYNTICVKLLGKVVRNLISRVTFKVRELIRTWLLGLFRLKRQIWKKMGCPWRETEISFPIVATTATDFLTPHWLKINQSEDEKNSNSSETLSLYRYYFAEQSMLFPLRGSIWTVANLAFCVTRSFHLAEILRKKRTSTYACIQCKILQTAAKY